MPANFSATQWEQVFEALGYYRWTGDSAGAFFNSDSTRKLGPPAVFFDVSNAVDLPVAVVRLYLIEQGFNRMALDAAIAAIGA